MPNGYRRSSVARGFQAPRPANDNSRMKLVSNKLFPNDTRTPARQFGRRALQRTTVNAVSRTALLGLTARGVARFIPYVGVALTLAEIAYEAYQWYAASQGGLVNEGSWRKIQDCGGGAGMNKSSFVTCGDWPLTTSQWYAGEGQLAQDYGTLKFAGYYKKVLDPHPVFGPGFIEFTQGDQYKWKSSYGPELPWPEIKSGAIKNVPAKELEALPIEFYPSVDPLSLPIHQPVPIAKPIPYEVIPHRKPNPARSPTEQPIRGPLPRRLPRGYPQPYYVPRPPPIDTPGRKSRPRPRSPRPSLPIQSPDAVPLPTGIPVPVIPISGKPAELPSAVELNPIPGGLPRIFAPPRSFHRPPPGTKERKVKIHNPFGRVVNIITETLDVLDALYWALPQDIRRKYRRNYKGKIEAVTANFQHIDVAEAIKNLIVNEIGDRIIGTVAKGIKHGNRPLGLTAGPAL